MPKTPAMTAEEKAEQQNLGRPVVHDLRVAATPGEGGALDVEVLCLECEAALSDSEGLERWHNPPLSVIGEVVERHLHEASYANQAPV